MTRTLFPGKRVDLVVAGDPDAFETLPGRIAAAYQDERPVSGAD